MIGKKYQLFLGWKNKMKLLLRSER